MNRWKLGVFWGMVLCTVKCMGAEATVESTLEVAANNGKTVLDEYVAQPDDTYQWKLVSTRREKNATIFVVDLTSQRWLRPDEVDRPVWKHWLTVVRPDEAKSNTALLFIGGGSNGKGAPDAVNPRTAQVALATETVVVELGTIPNQPLVFNGDRQPRSEDDLIAYTWDHYLKTGDTRWPARQPMVKSVVRAMDAVQDLLAHTPDSPLKIEKFVVAGGSKRGWTTWITGAVDPRVTAIIPIVIDVLNVNVSMQHHYAAYGFWAPAIEDYVHHQIPHRRYWTRYKELLQIEDPFAYRNRYTMPKCIINATGDEFFVPDSSLFYFDDLPGEKHLCYVPNTNHSLDKSDALDTLIAFHYSIVHNIPRPEFRWSTADNGTIRIAAKTKPRRVLHWQANNPKSRDFRVESIDRAYTSREVPESEAGVYEIAPPEPAAGWTAYFGQLEFDIGAPTPLRLTTPVYVTPAELPYAGIEPPTIPEP